ncbi:MAG: amylo-alpha-1,6-glucosidase [Bacteroidales bacterium]|jgi:predicted glycogen debranching enzyme|nr:amylo-alpha-1,6-glucosidase [Bacteroidales bacterium]
MSYINFDKNQLVNLEYSLNRELIRSNRAGSYANSTIINCNTRKYHGMLITPQPGVDHENHVLVSTMDETVIQMESEFNLGIHKYPGGVYNPKGHKYIRDFVTEPIPKLTYRVGGVILTKEMAFITREDRMIIRYTLVEAHSPTKIKIKPFLAFRNIHTLSKENIFADKKFEKITQGIKVRMYQGYTDLFIQISKTNEYTHVPDWYYKIEYQEEMERGYEYQEDLYVPGFFEFDIGKGESVYVAVGTQEMNPLSMKRAFNDELETRIPRNNFKNCLINAAQQFIVKQGKKTEILAGFPWFGRIGRNTFVALPGLTLIHGDFKTCKSVIDTMIQEMQGPFFPNIGSGNSATYNAVDTPLWFFWTLQQYAEFTGRKKEIWKEYGRKMKTILNNYRQGTEFGIQMDKDGLITAGVPGIPLTWMDAYVDGKPVTPRMGKCIEINALWYNAICFSMEIASLTGDKKFCKDWESISLLIPDSFLETFWNKEKRYMADYVDGVYKDWAVRPNMILVASLPYSPVSEEIRKEVLSRVKQELLTTRGLRTLTPKSPVFKGTYYGNQSERDSAYHQGTVRPWLLGHFAEGYLRIHGKSGLSIIKGIFQGFEAVMTEHGIGTISEIYDGDPPHTARGAISYATSVAELLRMTYLINKYEQQA